MLTEYLLEKTKYEEILMMKTILLSIIMLLNSYTLRAEQSLVSYFFNAAKIGETQVLQEFLSNGFPVDQRNAQSYTALMMAAYYGQAESVDQLLIAGANPCLKDKRGHTAIMGAILKAEWKIVKKLYKTDCSKAYSSGKTLSEFASTFGQLEKLKAIEKNLKNNNEYFN